MPDPNHNYLVLWMWQADYEDDPENDEIRQAYLCTADDAEHAKAQCLDANDDAVIIGVYVRETHQ